MSIIPFDVRVNPDCQISILGVDSVGFSVGEDYLLKEDDLAVGVTWDGIQDIVEWAYNLGLQNPNK